jgi:hypothetical protein
MLCALLLLAISVWLRGAAFNPVTQLGRPVIFAGLAVLAFRGASWARKLLGAWCGLLALAFAVAAINLGFVSAPWTIVALVFAAAAVCASFLLFTSDAIDAFVSAQRVRDIGARPAA